MNVEIEFQNDIIMILLQFCQKEKNNKTGGQKWQKNKKITLHS